MKIIGIQMAGHQNNWVMRITGRPGTGYLEQVMRIAGIPRSGHDNN
jgi:hypothetical protein